MGSFCTVGGRSVGVLAAVIAAAGSAQGAAFVVNSQAPSPAPFTVGANDFEFGLTINGALFQQFNNSPANGPVAADSFTFSGEFIDNGVNPALSRTVYFVDPSTLLVTDILSYTFTPNFGASILSGTFSSDSSPGSLGPVPGGTLPADIWPSGVDFNFGAFAFGGVIQTIPAPASAVLLGLGGLTLTRRRRTA